MERMLKWRIESLKFFKYLCQKIGSEKVVKTRRLAYTIRDMGHFQKMITSGSIGEGLNLTGSDIDFMFIQPYFQVYQSETEVQSQCSKHPLIINHEESHPCFTQLRPLDPNTMTIPFNYFQMNYRGNDVFSSKLFKLWFKNNECLLYPDLCFGKIHGPCVSNQDETVDLAWSLKCDKWINQAKPWISRPRTTWPSPEIISKIVSSGVLFVPIGNKGSINEHVEWRISFSVAEKFLIFSFSHTQLLCYAMLKIVLKEIVEKQKDLRGLLCSYFLKMMMFWISEETETHLWRPDNVIPCFMSCLQRLMYYVRYSLLSHYFIPDNNLFFSRFSTENKEKLTTLLKNVYEQGIHCFASSESLQDYQSQYNYEIKQSLTSGNSTFLQQLLPTLRLIRGFGAIRQFPMLVYNFLHNSRTSLSRSLFDLQISEAFMHATKVTQYQYHSANKHHYFRYKHYLSHLVIGLHSDAVSGLLKLASCFYVHKNYVASLTVIGHVLSKCTAEKIYIRLPRCKETLNHIQKQVLNLMKKEKLHTILKSLTIHSFQFDMDSSLIPQELQLDVAKRSNDFHQLPFAHFLSFLCYYHLHDLSSCEQSLLCLKLLIKSYGFNVEGLASVNTLICLGIAHQLMSETNSARLAFQEAAKHDLNNETSAARRLSSLI